MAKQTSGGTAARGVHAASTSYRKPAPKRDESRAPQTAARPSALVDTRVIYCGDNLEQLRKLPDACVDLIYIDPPFNSNRNYEVFWGETKEKRAFEDRHASTQAYIDFMRPRCMELARVLKKTGSFYYHCDWHASHYIKVMLDQIFGENNFSSEIVWKRTTTKSDYRQGAVNWPRIHDSIFVYHQDPKVAVFHQPFKPYSQEYIDAKYSHTDSDGRRYMLDNLTAPGAGSRGHPQYELMGVTRYWRYGKEKMMELVAEGRIVQPRPGAVPRYKRYLDEVQGIAIGTFWEDIDAINSQARESLGLRLRHGARRGAEFETPVDRH
jgi:hypothetical protein